MSFVKIKKDRQTILQEDELLKDLYLSCKDYGLAVNGWLYGEKSTIHLSYQQIYKKCLPVFHDFMNWVIDNKKDGDFVSYLDFKKSMKDIPVFEIPLRDYCMGQGRHLDKKINIVKQGSFEQLMKYAWEVTGTVINPVWNTNHLSYVVNREGKLYVSKENNMLLMRYHDKNAEKDRLGFWYVYNDTGKGVMENDF